MNAEKLDSVCQAIRDGAVTKSQLVEATGIPQNSLAIYTKQLRKQKRIRMLGAGNRVRYEIYTANGNGAAPLPSPAINSGSDLDLSPEETKLFDAIKNGAHTKPQMIEASGVNPSSCHSLLTRLLLKKVIARPVRGRYEEKINTAIILVDDNSAPSHKEKTQTQFSKVPELRRMQMQLLQMFDQLGALEQNHVPEKEKQALVNLAKRMSL